MGLDCRFFVGLQQNSAACWYKVNQSAAPEDLANRYIDLHAPLGGLVFYMTEYWTGEVPDYG